MASHYSLEQRFSLVLDCYKSGLSIPSWCKEKGITPGTINIREEKTAIRRKSQIAVFFNILFYLVLTMIGWMIFG